MTGAYLKVVLIVFVLVSLQMQAMLVCGSTCHNVPASVAQSAAIPSGSLLENVMCRATSDQSCSLYLPTNYTPQRKWPILYAFDPAARGLIPCYSLASSAYEQAESSLRAADYADAVFNFEVATEIAPDNPLLFFEMACAYALAGQKGRALQALRKAVEKGFSDLESITTNRALDSLRAEAVYMELVKRLQKKP